MTEVDAVLTTHAIARAESLAAIFRRKRLEQLRVGMELFLAAMELLLSAEDHICTPLEGANLAANLDCLTDKLLQIAGEFLIFVRTEQEEMAIGVGSLRAAHIQEMDSVAGIHDAVDVDLHTDIVMEILHRLVRGNAGMPGQRGRGK